MKAYRFYTLTFLVLASLIMILIGCKYDVAEPMWDKPATGKLSPVITGVNPAQGAVAGVNKITIMGNNFLDTLTDNQVYFDNIKAEIVTGSKDYLTVIRPNIISDSTTIKVVCTGALVVAKYSPYKVTSVVNEFVSTATQMDAIEIDRNENLYFVERTSLEIYKVTPAGVKTKIDTARTAVGDIKFAPNGKLLLIMPALRFIDQLDITTGSRTPWVYLNNNAYSCGDFDVNGNFYVGGRNRLYVISPDTSKKVISGYSSTESIIYLRVYNGYVYILTTTTINSSIWRHQILDATGNLGDREQVLDSRGSGFPSKPQKFTFSANGLLYIAADDTLQRKLTTYDLNNGQMETLYKGIIPSLPALKLVWGTGNLLYLMAGSGAKFCIFRIDVGTTGAPYYGR